MPDFGPNLATGKGVKHDITPTLSLRGLRQTSESPSPAPQNGIEEGLSVFRARVARVRGNKDLLCPSYAAGGWIPEACLGGRDAGLASV